MNLSSRFAYSLQWNTIGSAIYYVLLIVHQSIFFSMTDRSLYGLSGTIFSLLYLAVGIIDLGLDASLVPFLHTWTRSKQSFWRFLSINVAPNFLVGALLLGVVAWLKPLHHYVPHQYALLFILISAIILLESIRKTLRLILQLIFKSNIFAYAESLFIIFYTFLFWLPYFMGMPITLWTIFIPLGISSLIANLYLGWYLISWVAVLPHDTIDDQSPSSARIIKSRFSTWIHHLTSLLFSSNFLVPVFAARFGLNKAAILKLIGTIIHSVSAIIRKSFASSGGAVLAHAKYESLESQRTYFSLISMYLHQFLYGIIVFIIINHQMVTTHATLYTTSIMFIIASIILNIAETIIVAHEQFYITQERAHILAFMNSAACAGILTIIYGAPTLSPTYALALIMAVRLALCIALGISSFRSWRLVPSWHPQLRVVALSTIASILFLFIFK